MKIKIKFVVMIVLSSLLLSGCALSAKQLGAITTPEEITDSKYSFTYELDNLQIMQIVRSAVKSLDWVLLEEHKDVLRNKESGELSWKFKTKNTITSEYMKAWGAVSPDDAVDDLTFIKIRTPMSMFSFGAEIFIGISIKNNKTTIKYSASTTQIAEKDKLESYLNEISSFVSKNVVQRSNSHSI